jgi:hypothetical protein
MGYQDDPEYQRIKESVQAAYREPPKVRWEGTRHEERLQPDGTYKKTFPDEPALAAQIRGKDHRPLWDKSRITDPGAVRKVRAVRASEIKPKATRWLWQSDPFEKPPAHWIPLGGLVLLAGREGVGKSTIAYGIAAQITHGTLPGAFHGQPRGVIISATEDAWSQTVVPRLMACGADLDRVLRVDAVTPEGLPEAVKLPTDLPALEKLIGEVDAAMILLDPLMGTISGTLDSHKDHDVRIALEPISRLAADCQVSIVGLIHENKAGGSDLLNRIMASRAFSAVARAVLYAAKDQDVPRSGEQFADPDDGRAKFLFGQPKNNLAAQAPFTLRYHIEGVKVAHDEELDEDVFGSKIVWDGKVEDQLQAIVRRQDEDARGGDKETVSDRAADWLEGYLTEHGPTPSSVVKTAGKRAGFNDKMLKRIRDRVGAIIISIPTDQGRETVWEIPVSAVPTVPTVPTLPDVP